MGVNGRMQAARRPADPRPSLDPSPLSAYLPRDGSGQLPMKVSEMASFRGRLLCGYPATLFSFVLGWKDDVPVPRTSAQYRGWFSPRTDVRFTVGEQFELR